eukprot:jgi/Sobl393_1/1138/SZX59714.1
MGATAFSFSADRVQCSSAADLLSLPRCCQQKMQAVTGPAAATAAAGPAPAAAAAAAAAAAIPFSTA